MTQADILPDKLKTGDRIESPKTTAIIQRTSKRDDYGCTLYRLRYETGVLGSSRFTRDDLQELGCRLVSTN